VNIDKYEQFEVEQTYLIKTAAEEHKGFTFIRRRGQNGSYHYSYSALRDVPGEDSEQADQRAIIERQISGREYTALMKVSF
jgi:hypothetical protein